MNSFLSFFISLSTPASNDSGIACNRYILYAGLIFGIYLFLSWLLFGRDPEKETVVPQYKGPEGLTAAQAGRVYSYGHTEDECLIASILQNNISGFCDMQEEDTSSVAGMNQQKTEALLPYAPEWNMNELFSADQLKNLHKIIYIAKTRPPKKSRGIGFSFGDY